MSIPEEQARHVANTVVLAAYDALAERVAPLDAAAILSTLGAAPDSLIETIERRLPHWQVYAYEVAVSSHDLLKQGITEAVWTHVVISAPTEHEAALTAMQMVASHGVPLLDRVPLRFVEGMPTFLGCEH